MTRGGSEDCLDRVDWGYFDEDIIMKVIIIEWILFCTWWLEST
jgi:hypothetical protein